MTRKKKKNPSQTPSCEMQSAGTFSEKLLAPVVALRLVQGGPLENGRVWVAGESMVASNLVPGSSMLASVGGRCESTRPRVSSFAPHDLSPDMFFRQQPPKSLLELCGVQESEDDVTAGKFFVGCEVWPNAKLKKGEVQLSGCLAANVGNPPSGSVIYLHPVTPEKINSCQSMQLQFMRCLSSVGEERKERMEAMLQERGPTQIRILKTSILLQLNGRLILKDNIVPVLLMGCSVLFRVTHLESTNGEVDMATIDGDLTTVELNLGSEKNAPPEPVESSFLKEIRQGAEEGVEGSRKEAASEGAVMAASSGLRALESIDPTSVVLPAQLERSLHSLVISPLTTPSMFSSMGLTPPCGVILHGPPGSGKTMCASWAAKASGAKLFVIDGPSLLSEHYGGSESGLAGVFAAAKAVSPSLIFIDEIDAIAPSRRSASRSLADHAAHDSSTRLVTTLLSQFDALQGSSVVVLAATNRLESLDDALRRPGRFDREIEIGPPTPTLRLTLFSHYLNRISHSLTEDDVTALAFSAHGFLPADIAALCREASLCALRRWTVRKGPLSVLKKDLVKARGHIRPSGLRELHVEVPRVRWEDIGGVEGVKQQLRESVEWPIKHASSLERMGTAAPKGILLFGPPGCSKTLLANAVATETGMNVISITASEMLSVYVGESEKAIGKLFARARLVTPCVIFVDEVDGMMSHREGAGDDGTAVGQRVLSQLLVEMDGIRDRGQILVIGATNKPQLIDGAMLRPGRFDRLIFVPPPDSEARQAIFAIQFRNMAISGDVDVEELARRTEHYTGADIVSICREAGVCALEEDMDVSSIAMRHFLQAIEGTGASIGDDEMQVYEEFRRGSV